MHRTDRQDHRPPAAVRQACPVPTPSFAITTDSYWNVRLHRLKLIRIASHALMRHAGRPLRPCRLALYPRLVARGGHGHEYRGVR